MNYAIDYRKVFVLSYLIFGVSVAFASPSIEELQQATNLWDSMKIKTPGYYTKNGWIFVFSRNPSSFVAINNIASSIKAKNNSSSILQDGSLSCRKSDTQDYECLFIYK